MSRALSVVLSEIKTPKSFYAIILLILFLIICIFYILYNVNINNENKSKEETVKNILIVLFFVLIIFSICIGLLPNFNGVKTLFEQISSVTYIIIYTIFLILFFRLVPSDVINVYAYIILPITILL
jgi:hypothetical protein